MEYLIRELERMAKRKITEDYEEEGKISENYEEIQTEDGTTYQIDYIIHWDSIPQEYEHTKIYYTFEISRLISFNFEEETEITHTPFDFEGEFIY